MKIFSLTYWRERAKAFGFLQLTLQLLDALSTYLAVHLMGAVELNPFMAPLVEHPIWMAVVKSVVGVTILCLFLAEDKKPRLSNLSWRVWQFITWLYIFVVSSNFIQSAIAAISSTQSPQ